ncbi:peptidylprolyl isomerase [Xanthomonas arboricola pv. pruni str. MAFF 311562]|uniref:Chaperone SurA n=1 Tax=Xanthomonas arboricola pv. pruni str. MAFF 311562 TaxID=1414836 RepID=W4S7Q9_9XANT|nr:peptidylprolyl isomerase [Xanthomonas arboricola pv. pruni str. MAFF 311562]
MTKPFSVVLASLLVLTSTLSPLASAQQSQPLDRIAAIVDEDVVLQSELDRAVRNVKSQYAGRENQLPPDDVLQRQVLERLVRVKLQVGRADGSGIRVSDEELNRAIASIAQQNGTTVDGLRQKLAADGMGYGDFRASVRDEIIVQHLRQSFAQSRISVSEGEVDTALAQQATTGSQYHLAHILVGLPEGATADQIATGQKKVDGVKALIDKGELDFSAAAVRYSDSPNALEGGDLGWRSLDEIPNAFAQLIRDMQPGQVAGPLRGPSGFQLLKLVEMRDANAGGEKKLVTEYNARHILVRINDSQTEAQAKAKIDTLRARITGGADFQLPPRSRPKTPTAVARVAIWAGSRPMRSARTSASRSKGWPMARCPNRSAPRRAGTSCSAWAAVRPTSVPRASVRRSVKRSAAASWRKSTTAICRNCVAKRM